MAGLDPTDCAMLELLQMRGRITVSELARAVGLSQPATSERLKRLEEKGVIGGYRAVLNLDAVGLSTMAIVRLRTTHEHIPACLKLFEQLPEVVDVLRVTGEDCFHVKVVVPAPAALERLVDTIARYGPVSTSVVLRSGPQKPISRKLLRGGERPD